jgi:hypothetical protein
MMKKYLLCRPIGGLNDMFRQIIECVQYSKRFDRVLILDTYYKNTGFMDYFDKYFYSSDKGYVLNLSEDLLRTISSGNISPLKDLENYDVYWNDSNHRWCYLNTTSPATFDFTKQHEQNTLVHHWYPFWGEQWAVNRPTDFFNEFIFTEELTKNIFEIKKFIPEDYVAVHVRNTDYQTDFMKLFNLLRPAFYKKNVLICSDDIKCIEYAKKHFLHSNIFTVTESIDYDGKPLHTSTELDRFWVNRKAIIDLYFLGNANTFYCGHMVNGRISGYSALALYLNNNKVILQKLTGEF